jgi:hypothetical protein
MTEGGPVLKTIVDAGVPVLVVFPMVVGGMELRPENKRDRALPLGVLSRFFSGERSSEAHPNVRRACVVCDFAH